jgi:hypothetical protein
MGSKLPRRNERISSKLLSITIGNGSDDADAKGGNDDGMELEEKRSTRRQTKISCAERAKISIEVELSNIGDSGGGSECWTLPPLVDEDGSGDDDDDDDNDDGDNKDSGNDSGVSAQITCRMRDDSDSVAITSSAVAEFDSPCAIIIQSKSRRK